MDSKKKYVDKSDTQIIVTTETRNNEKQTKFRNKLIEIYGEKCIITDMPKPIEACHIVPFSECNNFDISNGLLMSCNIHSLFDSFDISINPKTLCVELLDENDYYHKIYNNKKISIPLNLIDTVKTNLKVHYKKFLDKKNNSYKKKPKKSS